MAQRKETKTGKYRKEDHIPIIRTYDLCWL